MSSHTTKHGHTPGYTPGYTKDLLVLPFDHRGSFQTKMFGIEGTPTKEQTALVASFKEIVYDGFEAAVASGLPHDKMGILVDEQFGEAVVRRAKAAGFAVSMPVEKSGQQEFDFEYGDKFREHIEKFQPTFVKVLVRYNSDDDTTLNKRQAARLAELSTYLAPSESRFMFELLVPPTQAQLDKCGSKHVYDRELRPALMIRAIEELQDAGVEADIWKIEGLDTVADFKKVVSVTKRGGRTGVSCIVLGRGENDEKVRQWLEVGAAVDGVVGFAVGRTVFWEPLKQFKEQAIDRAQAVQEIATKYSEFCRFWLERRARRA